MILNDKLETPVLETVKNRRRGRTGKVMFRVAWLIKKGLGSKWPLTTRGAVLMTVE